MVSKLLSLLGTIAHLDIEHIADQGCWRLYHRRCGISSWTKMSNGGLECWNGVTTGVNVDGDQVRLVGRRVGFGRGVGRTFCRLVG